MGLTIQVLWRQTECITKISKKKKKRNCGWQIPHFKNNTELLAVYYKILVYRNYDCLFFLYGACTF